MTSPERRHGYFGEARSDKFRQTFVYLSIVWNQNPSLFVFQKDRLPQTDAVPPIDLSRFTAIVKPLPLLT
jgi:hypothetical protein